MRSTMSHLMARTSNPRLSPFPAPVVTPAAAKIRHNNMSLGGVVDISSGVHNFNLNTPAETHSRQTTAIFAAPRGWKVAGAGRRTGKLVTLFIHN